MDLSCSDLPFLLLIGSTSVVCLLGMSQGLVVRLLSDQGLTCNGQVHHRTTLQTRSFLPFQISKLAGASRNRLQLST